MREQLFQQLQNSSDPTQVRQKLHELEATYPDLALTRQIEELQELALKVLLEGASPAALKKAMQKGREALGEPLTRLESLVNRLGSEKEGSVNAAGQLQFLPSSSVGPLLIDVLEELSAAARALWPEIPSPGEVVSWFWPLRPQAASGPDRGALRQQLERISQLDQVVAATNSKVKLIDRINIFTDSPEETRLREHKADLKKAEARWKEVRRDYHDQAAAERGQREATFLVDRLACIIRDLSKVTTRTGKSSSPIDCPLLNADRLIPECNWLLEQQGHRHGLSGDYESLTQRVCEARPGQGSFPEQLKAHLGDSLNAAVKAAQLAESEHQEAAHFTAGEQKKVTLMDKINIFTDSPREKAAKEAQQVQTELGAAAQHARENIRVVLMDGLSNFAHANLYYMCVELRDRCASIRAVCRSKRYHTGSGQNRRTEIRYFCDVQGVTPASQQALLCASTCHQLHGQVYGLYRELTFQRMRAVTEPSLGDLIRRLYG